MMRTAAEYFFTFMIFSVGGWITETLLYIIRDKMVVKRGFLFGPVCPIYGTGAVICTAVLYGRVNNIFLLFLYGMLMCGALEYITHFLMEKLFNAVWWDYSDRRFNIKGRVYLKGLIFFGIGTLLIVKVLQPLVFKLTDLMPNTLLYAVCFALYTVLIIDITATVENLKNLVSELKRLQSFLVEKGQATVDSTGEMITEIKENSEVSAILQKFRRENRLLEKINQKHPGFSFNKYKKFIDIINDTPREGMERSDIKIYGTGKEQNTENNADGKTDSVTVNDGGKSAE